jgi:hypothetical protein
MSTVMLEEEESAPFVWSERRGGNRRDVEGEEERAIVRWVGTSTRHERQVGWVDMRGLGHT